MAKRSIKIEIYRESTSVVEAGQTRAHVAEWRWRAIGPNGKIMANGGESYQRRGAMTRSIHRLFGESFPIVEA